MGLKFVRNDRLIVIIIIIIIIINAVMHCINLLYQSHEHEEKVRNYLHFSSFHQQVLISAF